MSGLLVGIPAGPTVDSQFLATLFSYATGGKPVSTIVGEGPYVALNMRGIVAKALELPGWDRLLVLETDMLGPPDMFLRHAAHTAPVVGALYFMHYPPYMPVATLRQGKMWRPLQPSEIAQLAGAGEGVFKVDSVGLGSTSIRRDVLEHWPKHLPYFQSQYSRAKGPRLENSYGEVSHDAWFCQQVRKQGYEIFLDPSIRMDHLSKVRVNLASFAQYHGLDIPGVAQVMRAADRVEHTLDGFEDGVEEVALAARA